MGTQIWRNLVHSPGARGNKGAGWEKQLLWATVGRWDHPKYICRRKKPISYFILMIRKPRNRAVPTEPPLRVLSFPTPSQQTRQFMSATKQPYTNSFCRWVLVFCSFLKCPGLLSCCTSTTAHRFSHARDSSWSLIL